MVMDAFSAPHFRNDDAARMALESILWPDGPVCPHCGGIVEADETYYGRTAAPTIRDRDGKPFVKRSKTANRRPILSLVERGGKVRSFHIPSADKGSVQKIVKDNIARETRLHTDESNL